MLALFLKSLLGATAVLIIALLSKTSNFFVAGLVPLFPTFALIAHYIGRGYSLRELLELSALEKAFFGAAMELEAEEIGGK